MRTSVISIASASEISRTRAPRFRWNSTRPCADRSCRAARTMNLDVPNRSHRSTSTSRCRGAYSPCEDRRAKRVGHSRPRVLRHAGTAFRAGLTVRCTADRRGPVGVERRDRGEPPGLPLRAFGLRPADRAPVRREDQPRAGVAQLDPVPARLVDVEEERLLDGVLVRPGLDEHPAVQADVRGAQDVLAGVGGERDVVQPPAAPGPVVGVDEVVGLLREVQPLRGDRAVVEHDLLGDPAAERPATKSPFGLVCAARKLTWSSRRTDTPRPG